MGVTRAFVHHVAAKETVGAHLLTMHNVWYQLNLMRSVREAIVEDRFPEFLKQFFSDQHGGDKEKYPEWAVEALRTVGVDLLSD
jgi:queuine tRNA-ribosyltransferase